MVRDDRHPQSSILNPQSSSLPGGGTLVPHASDSIVHDGARAAGVLLHPAALPGSYGVGDLGDELTAFLDWAVTAGMRIWQTLPLNPPGYGNSPYGCLSSFAGNPLLIDVGRVLNPSEVDGPAFPNGYVDFNRVTAWKMDQLRLSYAHFDANASDQDRQGLAAFER